MGVTRTIFAKGGGRTWPKWSGSNWEAPMCGCEGGGGTDRAKLKRNVKYYTNVDLKL